MQPLKLIAVPENTEDRILASIHVNDFKGKNLCMLWMDEKISFNPNKDFSIDEIKHFTVLSSIFHTLFNNLTELQTEIEELNKEILFTLTPTLGFQ